MEHVLRHELLVSSEWLSLFRAPRENPFSKTHSVTLNSLSLCSVLTKCNGAQEMRRKNCGKVGCVAEIVGLDVAEKANKQKLTLR